MNQTIDSLGPINNVVEPSNIQARNLTKKMTNIMSVNDNDDHHHIGGEVNDV